MRCYHFNLSYRGTGYIQPAIS